MFLCVFNKTLSFTLPCLISFMAHRQYRVCRKRPNRRPCGLSHRRMRRRRQRGRGRGKVWNINDKVKQWQASQRSRFERMRRHRQQRGRGWFKTARNTAGAVHGTLKMAGRHARNLSPNNFFRRSTVNAFGIPPSMQRRMYNRW